MIQRREKITMARCERATIHQPVGADGLPFVELGMMHASGRAGRTDLIAAHKWFNLAAMQGNAEAARLRLEIAAEMSSAEIAVAQRAAREWKRAR
jgi:TPR repeat protein